MQNIKDYIESGILELYVLGVTNDEENKEIAKLASSFEEIRNEIESISESVEAYANENAISPNPALKPFLMTIVDYTEKMKSNSHAFPPILTRDSKIEDYAEWINQADAQLPADFKDIHAKIIGDTGKVGTAIIWIKNMAPQETHDDELEKFLILEGTCDITIENILHHLSAGDYLSIPLHTTHDIKITSSIPCKAILQRIAA